MVTLDWYPLDKPTSQCTSSTELEGDVLVRTLEFDARWLFSHSSAKQGKSVISLSII